MVNEKFTKNILGLSLEMQFAGKEYSFEGKSGTTKESIAIKSGKAYCPLSPLQLLGIFTLQNDQQFMKELNRRAIAQEQEIKQYMPTTSKSK